MVSFKILKEHCKHQGMIKEGKKWCGFKGGVPARCWSDWQECSAANCPLSNGTKKQYQEESEQISIEEFFKE